MTKLVKKTAKKSARAKNPRKMTRVISPRQMRKLADVKIPAIAKPVLSNIAMSTLRPGLLVSLKTSVTGNIKYEKRIIDNAHMTKQGTQQARWETERTIFDPKEYDAAHKARSQARVAITRVCSASAFGLLCPEADGGDLNQAVADARAIAEKFNATAKLSRLHVYVITGRVASDDVEAVRAINSEVRDLLEEMENGLKTLNVKAVRDAANKAKGIGAMLSPDASARITLAIEAARGSAREIVKAGDQIAMDIDKRAIRTITEQRTAFLDLDMPAKEIATPKSQGRALDLQAAPAVTVKAEKARKIEVD